MERPLEFEVSRRSLMRAFHHLNLILTLRLAVLCLLIILFGFDATVAQQPGPSLDLTQGIQLYKQGDYDGAIKILQDLVSRSPDDADAWYYLGLAFHVQGITGAARMPFERVVQLRPRSADAHAKLAYILILANEPQKATAIAERAIELGDLSAEPHYAIAEASLRTHIATPGTQLLELVIREAENTLRIDPNFSLALLTRSFAHYHMKQYSEAAENLKSFLALAYDNEDAKAWQEHLMKLEQQAHDSQPGTNTPAAQITTFTGREVTQKVRVLSKPEPSYTQAGRKAGVQGTVVLRAVFSSDGKITNLYVTQALPFGLTTSAIQAARQIKFTPAMKDGQVVSMNIQLEYNFNLY
jgi:TonB family protein